MEGHAGQPDKPAAEPESLVIQTGPESQRVLVDYVQRHMPVYSITDPELDAFASAHDSVDLALFGVAIGAFLLAAVTLLTVGINDAKVHGSFVALLAVSAFAVPFFGVRARVNRQHAQDVVNRIRRRT